MWEFAMIIVIISLVATSLGLQAAIPSRPERHSDDELPTSLDMPRQQVVADDVGFSIREASASLRAQQPAQRLTFKLGAHVALPRLTGSSASRKETTHEAR
jgi:hypothetical protein